MKKLLGLTISLAVALQSIFVTAIFAADYIYANDFESSIGFSSGALVSEIGGRSGNQLKLSLKKGESAQLGNINCIESFTMEWSTYLCEKKGNWIIELVDDKSKIFGNAIVLQPQGKISSCYPVGDVSSYEVGKWQRFAVEVTTGTQNYNLYINGEKIDTSGKIFANTDTNLSFNTFNRIKISNTADESSLYMDDLKIYKGAYNVYSGENTLSSEQYNIQGDKIYISSADLTVGELLENLTSTGTLKLYSDPAYLIETASGDKVGRVAYLVENVDKTTNYYTVFGGELQMYYDFDAETLNSEGNAITAVNDVTGNGFDGEISNCCPTFSENGVNGGAIRLSGNVNDKQIIKVKNSENNFVYNASDSYTISVWVKKNENAVTEWKGIAVKGKATGKNSVRDNYYGIWNSYSSTSTPYCFSGSYNNSGINIYGSENSSEEWTHLAAVQKNNKIYFYVNGKAANSTPASQNIDTAGQPLYIGGVHPDYGRQFFGGEVDDFGIFNYALSETEIAELVKKKTPMQIERNSINSEIAGNLANTIDKAKTVPFNMYTAESAENLKKTIAECEKIISSAEDTDTDEFILSAREALLKLKLAKDALCELPSLQAHITFDEITDGVAADSTGNGFNAVSVGSAPIVQEDSERGKAALFDGQIFKINNSDDNFVYNASDSYTMSVWVKPSVIESEWKGIAVKGRDAGAPANTKNYYGMWIAGNANSNSYAYSGKQGSATVNIYSGESAKVNEWKNLVIIQDGNAGTVTFYVDGKACSTVLKSGDVNNAGKSLYIGGANETMSNQRFKGLIDDFAVFNYAIGAVGVGELANGKTPEEVHQLKLTYDAAQLLKTDITEAEKINESDYLSNGMEEFKSALANAKFAVEALESIENIQQAQSNLRAAITALVKKQMIAGWIFEQKGKSFSDLSGNAYTASSTDEINVIEGKKKKAAEFSSQKLTVDTSGSFALTNEFTLTALIKPQNVLAGSIIKKGTGWNLYLENNCVKLSVNGTAVLSGAIVQNEWSFITVIKGDGIFNLYINNEPKDSCSALPDIANGELIEIADGYSGLLEDLRIYNYCTNSEEREKMYKRATLLLTNDEWMPSIKTPKLIFDTDFGGDIDDAGALAIIHNYIQNGMAELLAVIVNRTGVGDTAAGIDALNTFYGSPDIPIGVNENEKNVNGYSGYGYYLAQNWENDIYHNYYAWDATSLYRKTLAEAEDNSVTIVITGHMTNLANLLRSGADEYSELSGRELVAEKVKFISMMGGGFTPPTYQPEHNIIRDLESSTYVIENSPVKILFSGYEIGHSYWTAGKRKLLGDDHPLKTAYDLYFEYNIENSDSTRASYDQTSVIAAVEGLKDYWDIKIGTCSVDGSGYVHFDEDGYSNHAYLIVKKDAVQMQEYIDSLMMNVAHDNPDERIMTNIDNEDSSVSYTGTFTLTGQTNMSYKGACRKTTIANSAVEYRFVGNRVEIFGTKGIDAGKIEVFIDNVSQGIFDMYQKVTTYGVPLFKSDELSSGEHTVKAVLISDKNSASASTAFYFDGFKVYADYTVNIQKDEAGNFDISIKQFSKNGILYAALFNSENELVDMRMTDKTEYGRHKLRYTASEAGNNKIKAFYWSEMTPLTVSAIN